MISTAKKFRKLLDARKGVVVPGCHDAIGARLIEQAGFAAAYMSGFCVASSMGKADVGILTMTDMVQRAEIIAGAVSIPLFSDADTGYGSIPNVVETVRRFEHAGAAAIHIEDQTTPKKCAAIAGKQLIPIAEMQQKIAASLAARVDPNFSIIARTDAVITDNVPEAIKRAKAWEEAGADAVMVMSLFELSDMKKLMKAVKCPVIVLMSETVRPTHPVKTLQALGFSLILYPLTLIMTAAGASRSVLSELKTQGDTKAHVPQMMPFAELNTLAGLPEIVEWETKYSTAKA